jgi:hypothetical protein
MKRFFQVLTALSICIAARATVREGPRTCRGFAPPNSMRIPVGQTLSMNFATPGPGGINEREFDAILFRLGKLYADEARKKGGHLKFEGNWSDPTVNAFADRLGADWTVEVPGGIARHKATSVEGFVAIVCHELGHHLGGAPKHIESNGDANWATNEGGADYYSALKCMRRFFAEDDNASIVGLATIHPLANECCLAQFRDPTDQLICLRESMATESAANLLADLSGEKIPAFDQPDPKVVLKMVNTHPDVQCRMDTFFAGSICAVDRNVPNSDADFKEGACVQGRDVVGFRPRCWFLPPDINGPL